MRAATTEDEGNDDDDEPGNEREPHRVGGNAKGRTQDNLKRRGSAPPNHHHMQLLSRTASNQVTCHPRITKTNVEHLAII
jgi:hypothetical protein